MQMQLQKITAINHPFALLFYTTIQDFPQPLVCPWIYFKKKTFIMSNQRTLVGD